MASRHLFLKTVYLLVPESVKWNFLPGLSLLISPVVRAFVRGWSTVKQNVSYNRNRILNVANLGLESGKIHTINIMKTTGFVPGQKVSISITRDECAFWKTLFQHHWITHCFESIPNHNISFNWIKYHVAFRRQFEIHFEFRSVLWCVSEAIHIPTFPHTHLLEVAIARDS